MHKVVCDLLLHYLRYIVCLPQSIILSLQFIMFTMSLRAISLMLSLTDFTIDVMCLVTPSMSVNFSVMHK